MRESTKVSLKETASLATSKYAPDHKGDAMAYNAVFSSDVAIGRTYVRNDVLTVTRSVRDVDGNKMRTFIYNVPLAPPSQKIKKDIGHHQQPLVPPQELCPTIKLIIPSPSGQKIAKLVEEEISSESSSIVSASKKRYTWEIWTHGGTCLDRRSVIPDNLHGKLCTDNNWFGGVSWRCASPISSRSSTLDETNTGDESSELVEEDALVYVAEQSHPKTQSFFTSPKTDGDKSSNVLNRPKEEEKVQIGKQYTLGVGKGEDWGEKYTGTTRLRLYVLSTKTGRIGPVNNVPGFDDDDEMKNGENTNDTCNTHNGYTLGQPIFSPCGSSLVYTSWDAGGGGEMPRRLGSIYCCQRPSKLYASSVEKLLQYLSKESPGDHDDDISVGVKKNSTTEKSITNDSAHVCLTPNDRLARSPRFCHETSQLAFLCNTEGFDTHDGCMGLHVLDWDLKRQQAASNSRRVLVDVQRLPSKDYGSAEINCMSFPGLFLNQLPEECFSPDGKYIYLSSFWGSMTSALKISTKDGRLTPLHFTSDSGDEKEDGCRLESYSVLSVAKEGVILCKSSPTMPATIGRIDHGQNEDICVSEPIIYLMPISTTSFSSSMLTTHHCFSADMAWQVINMKTPGAVDSLPPLQAIYLCSTAKQHNDGRKPPLIVVPHGGPHSCSPTRFLAPYTFLCRHGSYAVLLVNYRGSTGFGQDFLESLPGNIGTADVVDVVHATQKVIEMDLADKDRVGVCGGSHGGFLAAHLVGQYPELYKVAAMRNPVTNIPSMTTTSDIPDWTYVENFGPRGSYDWHTYRPPKKEEIMSMWDASPVAHVENVKAPTLVALGMSDRRVPPSQGLEFYHSLRAAGVKTKLIVYETDVHAIDQPRSEADHWINVKQWFDEYLRN